MANYNTTTEDELFQFIEEYIDTGCKAELIMFWGRHPDTKFSKSAICLHCMGAESCDSLEELVGTGLFNKVIRNGTALYSLTTNEVMRRSVIALTQCSRARLFLILKYLKEKKRLKPQDVA